MNMSSGRLVAGTGLLITLALLVSQTHYAESANILGVFTSTSPSHLIVHMSVVKALAEKGHNVTVVLPYKPKVNHPAINVIIIPPSQEDDREFNNIVTGMAGKKNGVFTMMQNFLGSFTKIIDLQAKLLQDKRFTSLYENKDNRFDLIVLGYFMNDFIFGIGAKFNCPMIMSWVGPPNQLTDRYVANPLEVSYVPHLMLGNKGDQKMNFLERLQNFLISFFFEIFQKLMHLRHERYYKQIFGNDPTVPPLKEMAKNISIIFCNGHFSEGPIRPNLPAIIEIGGIQVKDSPDPLPKDIAEFLDSAGETGAILFSLGSNLKGDNIKPELVQIIYRVLSSLKQKVVWKWEQLDKLPGKSANILYKNWLPQDDILAHPNIKLFITHAGKGGIAEAQYHGVPMLALPVFAEQPQNAKKMAESGYGHTLDMLQLKEDEFKANILEVISNPKYKANIEQFSKVYRDRPLSAKETVVFWTEYIIRHHGAVHMQSPAVHMNLIELYNLDLICSLITAIFVLYKVVAFSLKKVRKSTKSSGEKKATKPKTKPKASSSQSKSNKKDKSS